MTTSKILLLKCLFILNNLSDEAIEEANESLDRIIDFYSEDLTSPSVTNLFAYQPTIKVTVLPPTIRPSLVLDKS
jgi:hypothetical protein